MAPPSLLAGVDKVLGKRKPEHRVKGGEKRRSKGGDRRSVYSMEVEDQEEWGGFYPGQESEDLAADHEHEAFAFQLETSRQRKNGQRWQRKNG